MLLIPAVRVDHERWTFGSNTNAERALDLGTGVLSLELTGFA